MPLGPSRSQADSYGFARNAARIFFGRSIPAKASMVVGLYLSTSCCMSQPLQRRDGAVKCVDERLGVAAITVAPEGGGYGSHSPTAFPPIFRVSASFSNRSRIEAGTCFFISAAVIDRQSVSLTPAGRMRVAVACAMAVSLL